MFQHKKSLCKFFRKMVFFVNPALNLDYFQRYFHKKESQACRSRVLIMTLTLALDICNTFKRAMLIRAVGHRGIGQPGSSQPKEYLSTESRLHSLFSYNTPSATALEVATGFFLSDFVVITLLWYHYG